MRARDGAFGLGLLAAAFLWTPGALAEDLAIALPDPAPLAGLSPHEILPPEALEGEPSKAEASTALLAADTALAVPPPPEAAPLAITVDDLMAPALAALLGEENRSLRLTRQEREALADFYARRNHEALWVRGNGFTPAARSLMARIEAADEDGLDPADYPLAKLLSPERASAQDWAEAELQLSAAAALYARDARGGRIDPSRLPGAPGPKLVLPNVGEVLASLASAPEAGAALEDYHPPHEGYRLLRARLAELRASQPKSNAPMARLPRGPALRVGMKDPRVPLIRARFNVEASGENETAYDQRLASAVAAFQKEKGLPASGVLDDRTVAALSGPWAARSEADIIANMERWRWLPRDLGARHIVVNVPEFRLRLFENGALAHQTRVVVGKPETPTPVFSDVMETVIVNPSWTIPPSILRKEVLPALASDPDYAARKGYQVIRNGKSITVRQPPGSGNALGYVKFIFPNDHAIYLHDTPSRHLFAHERRAYSHGCVRVEHPFRLAEAILSGQGSWSEQRLRALIGKGERYIKLREMLPVHLAYFTLARDEEGEWKSFEDLYGLDRKVKAALNL